MKGIMLVKELQEICLQLMELNRALDNVDKSIEKNGGSNFVRYKALLKYCQKHSDIEDRMCNRLERICQLILTNPELLNDISYNSDDERAETMEKVDYMLHFIDTCRRKSEELRQEVVLGSMIYG